ncbi:PTPRT-like protein [Mya arenaria]|uniref:PTPRT-like protein n=1 Tax=Mya arenaria TaxID=6604 RepID=A0ABY7G428_MYAAR|nr:PTPRT-like protein [Mya arenaria]
MSKFIPSTVCVYTLCSASLKVLEISSQHNFNDADYHKKAQDYKHERDTTTPGGDATQPGSYETLNTGRIENNDRKDTYTRLFTTGQSGMTKGASPNRSTMEFLNVVRGERDQSGPYEILHATCLKDNESSDTYKRLSRKGQAGSKDSEVSENINILMDCLTVVVFGTCPPGKYGDNCEHLCLYPHCFCVSHLDCGSCEAGYWNISGNCKFICTSLTCICSNYTNCHYCKDGYYGLESKCKNTCSSGCDDNKCDNNGYCDTCKPNFAGSKCDSCVDGRYGANCSNSNQTCSSGCNGDECYPNGTCLCEPNFTGKTCESCVDGYYGANCSFKCSGGCAKDNCSSSDGSCNCKNNYSGEKCEYCIEGRYGDECSKKCSLGCLEHTCSFTDGKCDCKEFYTGDTCDVCENGRYGEDCSKPCSLGCLDNTCSSTDGMCECRDFYTGDTCDVCVDGPFRDAMNEPTETDKQNVGVTVGGIIGAVLVVVAVVVVVIILKQRNELCWKKPRGEEQHSEVMHTVVYATVQKNRNTLYEDISNGTDDSGIVQGKVKQEAGHRVNVQTHHVELVMTEETTEDDVLEIDEDDQIARARAITFEEKGGIYYNNADKINNQKVAVNNLTKYVIEKTDIIIEEEFEKFPYGLTKPYAVSQKHEHSHRNRYKGIYPYDGTRVKLRDCETDYINASFIDGYNKRHAYIAALGPMSKQLGDFSPFWQMIWQEKVEKIVMLTNLVEDGKDKCEQYWPHPGTSQDYGVYFVSCLIEDEYADYTRKEFTISKGRETRELHHLHFTCWPDKGVPEDVTGIVEFRQRVLTIPGQFDGPVLVHCSCQMKEEITTGLVCSLIEHLELLDI